MRGLVTRSIWGSAPECRGGDKMGWRGVLGEPLALFGHGAGVAPSVTVLPGKPLGPGCKAAGKRKVLGTRNSYGRLNSAGDSRFRV